MLSKNELNPHGYPVDKETDENLDILLTRLNQVRTAYGKPMTVTSGLRSIEDQKRINPAAMSSKHLYGQAADIYDPDRELQTWVYDNLEKLEEIGLWMEAFQSTPNWVHFQIVPPRSGMRFFAP